MKFKEAAAAAKEILDGLPLPKFKKLQRSDVILIVVSFICALFLWVYIASAVATDYSVSLDKLPVTVDLSETRAESFGLDLLPDSREYAESATVDCTITGTRAEIGALTNNDVEAYIDFDTNVADTSGKQLLLFRLRTKSGTELDHVTFSPNGIELEMDKYETRSIKVKDVEHPNLTYDDETHIKSDEITYEPSTVQVYGPSAKLAALDHICVNLDTAEELVQTKTFDSTNFSLIDMDGNVVDKDAFQITTARFSVRIPVYYARSLPVTVVIEEPTYNFDMDAIMKRIRISSSNGIYTLPGYGDEDDKNLMITIKTSDPAKKEKLDQVTAWSLEEVISLSDLSPNMQPKEVPITMNKNEGFTDGSNLGSVYISLDTTDLETKKLWINNSDIQRINPDPRYTYAFEDPDGKTMVTLFGTPEELAKIEKEDLKASIRLLDITVSKEGVKTQPFTVTLPNKADGIGVWVSPTPTVNLVIKVADS